MLLRIPRRLSVLIILILSAACSKPSVSPNEPLAVVGDHPISVADFRQAYELTPAHNRARIENIEDRKRAVLEDLVENTLFAIAGREKGLDRSAEITDVLTFYESHAVIRALYRDVVQSQIQITEDELRDAFFLSGHKLYLRQFLFTNPEEAWQVYTQIQAGESFENEALKRARSEEELQHLLTPTEFRWGDLDEPIEQAAFGLEDHQVSSPIQSRLGYHVIQLVDRKENLIQTEHSFEAKRETLRKIIRRRREAALARAYLIDLAATQEPGLVGSALNKLADRTNSILREKSAEAPIPPFQQVYLLEDRISDLKHLEIVRMTGGGWSIGDFLDRLKKRPPTERFDLSSSGSITRGLAAMVRDDFLASEGYARGLEARPEVQAEVERRRNEIAAALMRQSVLDSVRVSSASARQYFDAHQEQYRIPKKVRAREVMVRSRSLADSLFLLIDSGSAGLEELARRYTIREWAREKGGDLGYFSMGAFGNLGERALQAPVGALEGPVPIMLHGVVSGYSVFRVLDHLDSTLPAYSALDQRVYEDALQAKKSQIAETFLEELKKTHSVRVNESLLASIHTTDDLGIGLPMDMMEVRRQ